MTALALAESLGPWAVRVAAQAVLVAALALAVGAATAGEVAEVTTVWQKTLFGDAGRSALIREVAVTPGGGYCMAGSVRNPIEGTGDWQADVWIVRLDTAGEVVWDRTYGGDDDEWGESLMHFVPAQPTCCR